MSTPAPSEPPGEDRTDAAPRTPDPSTPDQPSPETPTREPDPATDGPARSSRWALLALTLLVPLAFLGGWLVGRPSHPGDTGADAGFARDMQQHHAQAVEMSLTALQAGVSPDVRTLAYDIATSQENQRGQMRGWLETWGLPQARSGPAMAWMASGHHGGAGHTPAPDGRMPGMADQARMTRLRSLRGKDAEILFLQLMIPHHRGGVEMARACVAQCSQPAAVGLARAAVAGQSSEIALMTSMLRSRGAQLLPQAG